MKISETSSQLRAAGIAIVGCVALAGVAGAQEAVQPVAAQPSASAAPVPIDGIWGDIAEIDPVQAASCFNEAADVGGGRVSERNSVYGRKSGQRWIAFEQDCGIRNRGYVNKPMYKPEYWDTVRLLDYNANVGGEWEAYADPVWQNMPEGVPRMGPPNKIVYTADSPRGPEATLLWAERNTYKVVPADCREHDPVLAYDQSLLGHAVGCWEGNTFVVHSKGFADTSWLHWSGWMHSNEMEVIERFTVGEDGNTLLYETTVIDPVTLLEPWVMDPVLLERNTNPEAVILEDVPYIERSLGVMALPRNRG